VVVIKVAVAAAVVAAMFFLCGVNAKDESTSGEHGCHRMGKHG